MCTINSCKEEQGLFVVIHSEPAALVPLSLEDHQYRGENDYPLSPTPKSQNGCKNQNILQSFFYYTTQSRLDSLETEVTQLQKQIKRVTRLNKK